MFAFLSDESIMWTRVWVWVLISSSFLTALDGCGHRCSDIDSLNLPKRSPVQYPDQIVDTDRPLAIIGDTQRTSWNQCVFTGRRINDREQHLLIRSLARARPGALVLVGDLVFDASEPEHWSFFDHLMDPIRQADIPLLPLMGNHEYYSNKADARSHVNQRFPRLRSTEYYVEKYGRLVLVLLNSNKDQLDVDVWAEQLEWYQERLRGFDEDDSIDGVLVFLHHPPYTKSKDVDGKMASDFVDGFSRARKTLGMISGHAHGFECIRKSGKFYIVTAGGGGALQPRDGPASCPAYDSNGRRLNNSALFNYLLIHQNDKGIRIDITGLAEGETSARHLATIEIPFSE